MSLTNLKLDSSSVRTRALELQESQASRTEAYVGGIEDGPTDDNMANVAMIEPIPPNGGYGWVCAFGVFLINAHTWGINASWAVIMAHYSLHSSKMEASHIEYSLVGGLSISQGLIISPLVAAVRKCIGTRPTLLLGTVLIFISLLTSSFATKIWHLFLSQGFCFGWGMGCCYITATAVLPSWFTSRRSLAVGVATSGSGIGGLIYSIATNAIIEKLDVGWAYRILAFCALGSNLLGACLIREWRGRTQVVQEELRFDARDFGRVQVLLIIIWGLCTDLGYIILLYSLPTYASSIGLTPAQGAVSSALLNLGLAVARPSVGYFSDSFGRINIAGVMTFLCAFFCFTLWIPSQSYPPLLAFSLLGGALCGTFWGTVTPVLAEVVGMHKLGSTFGVICLSMVLPTTFAELLAMEMVDPGHGSSKSIVFTNAQLFVGFMFLTGALSVWFLRCWKIFEVEGEQSANGTSSSLAPPVRRSRYWVSWLTPRLLFSFEKV